MPMANPNTEPLVSRQLDIEEGDIAPACVMTFNASDPSGVGGLTADVTAITSAGAHPLAIVTGAYIRDTAEIFDHFSFDDEVVAEQARVALEDMQVSAIKVGFAGSPENISAIAQIATDYSEVPVVAYMPDLSWWDESEIDSYLDAFCELLLPQVTLLIGNHSTLWRWLLPDWPTERSPSARDIAKAASAQGVPYTLVTGMALNESFIDNVLATPQAVLYSEKFERFEATFEGTGETLSAALCALLANGHDLQAATAEALTYLDHSLDAGFQPGMGHVVPDRLFWAQAESDEDEDKADDEAQDPEAHGPAGDDNAALLSQPPFELPPNGTKH